MSSPLLGWIHFSVSTPSASEEILTVLSVHVPVRIPMQIRLLFGGVPFGLPVSTKLEIYAVSSSCPVTHQWVTVLERVATCAFSILFIPIYGICYCNISVFWFSNTIRSYHCIHIKRTCGLSKVCRTIQFSEVPLFPSKHVLHCACVEIFAQSGYTILILSIAAADC